MEFNNLSCLKVLYFSPVCFILEYGSIIWNPHQASLINKIEHVQTRLLRTLAYKTNKTDVASLEQLEEHFNIESLEKKRKSIMNNDVFCALEITEVSN
jgi:hypothetical protein